MTLGIWGPENNRPGSKDTWSSGSEVEMEGNGQGSLRQIHALVLSKAQSYLIAGLSLLPESTCQSGVIG